MNNSNYKNLRIEKGQKVHIENIFDDLNILQSKIQFEGELLNIIVPRSMLSKDKPVIIEVPKSNM